MKKQLIIGLVMLIFFIISFVTNILNSISSDVKESFELSLTLTGFLPFSFFIAYGIMSIPAGILLERYKEKRVLVFSFVMIAFSSFAFALFPDYLVFTASLFLLGCSMAVLQVVINPMLRAAGGEENFAFNSVLAQLVFGLASFLSPYLYQYVVNPNADSDFLVNQLRSFFPSHIPWASLYLIFAFVALLMIFVVSVVKYPKVSLKSDEKSGTLSVYLSLLKNRTVLLFGLGIFCYVGMEQGVGNWISQFLKAYHDQDPQTVGATVVSYFWGALTVGCFAGLVTLKFMDSRHVLIIFSGLTFVALLTALHGSLSVALIAFPCIGFFISVMWSVIFSLGMNSMSEHHGSVSGVLCSGIVGGAVVPLIVGGIGELISLKVGMYFLFVTLAYVFSIGFWAKPLVSNKTII